MDSFPKVFIIVLNYNGKECIKKTIASVFRIKYPNFEVVMVDNGSTDGSLEMIRGIFSKISLIKNRKNLGFSAGNNVGIKYALERGAKYVMLLNYDTQVEDDFLKSLVETMEKDVKNGVGSPIILKNNSQKVWFSGGEIDWLKIKTKHLEENLEEDYFDSDYISGCAMIIKAEVFKKIGLLDEDYFLYWEDADFSQKAKKAGYKLVVSKNSKIYHFEKSWDKKENKIYWLVISGLIFFKKNTPFWLRPWIFCYILGRRYKNLRDIKLNRNSINEIVRKAYDDFGYVK